MRFMVMCALIAIYWGGLYSIVGAMKDERLSFAAFVVTLIVSMVTAAVFTAKRK